MATTVVLAASGLRPEELVAALAREGEDLGEVGVDVAGFGIREALWSHAQADWSVTCRPPDAVAVHEGIVVAMKPSPDFAKDSTHVAAGATRSSSVSVSRMSGLSSASTYGSASTKE